jgi:hypothetical protein
MAICGVAGAAGLASLLWVENRKLQLGLEIGCGIIALVSSIMVFVRWDHER